MGWFRREPDAIDRLCESLRTKPWEWTESRTDDDDHTLLTHLTGVKIVITGYSDHYGFVYLGQDLCSPCDGYNSRRIWAAYLDHLSVKVKGRKADFGPTAKELATAILNGDESAAIGLCDWCLENLPNNRQE